MSIFSGNLSIRVSIELRSRILIFPRIRKESTIICCRAYQSSGPVRYTPGNYSTDKEKQKSPLMKSFKEKSIDCSLDSNSSRNTRSHDKTVTQRLLNSDDGSQHQFLNAKIIPEAETRNLTNTFGSMMELSELEDNTSNELEIMDDHLAEVSETDNFEFKLSDDNSVLEMDTACNGKIKQDAENLAIKVLATRAFTAVELRKKLHGRKFSHDVIEAVITDFRERLHPNWLAKPELLVGFGWVSIGKNQIFFDQGILWADSFEHQVGLWLTPIQSSRTELWPKWLLSTDNLKKDSWNPAIQDFGNPLKSWIPVNPDSPNASDRTTFFSDYLPDKEMAVFGVCTRNGQIGSYIDIKESFSQSRWHSLSWGPRRIKQALLRKGVSEADAEKATKHVFEDDGSDSNQDINLGMSKLSMDHLLAQASKQWLRGQDAPLETRKSRIVRWLQYRGFSWGVTSFILRKLEAQYPP